MVSSEVLKLLFERKTDLEKISTKYQLVLNKYLEKCKHYDKLKEECNDVCILNDQQQTTISALQEELSQCKAEHTKLQVTYAEFVNHSHLEYQNIIKEHETKIALLEDEASKAKKTCASCNKTIKNVDQFVFERTGSPERCKRRRKLKEDTQIVSVLSVNCQRGFMFHVDCDRKKLMTIKIGVGFHNTYYHAT